MIDEDLK